MTVDSAKQVPGIIFDLDGTLLDTLEDITDSLNEVFSERGLSLVTRSQTRALIGEGLKTLMVRASGCHEASRLDSLLAHYREVYRRRLLNRTHLYEGIASMLDELAAIGTPCCILSNKSDEFTVPLCERLLGRWRLIRVEGMKDEAFRKPDPRVALEMSKGMTRTPGDVFFVGDSDTDVETGRNAGMVTVAVTWGYRNRTVLDAARPDHLISRPGELIALIKNRCC